VSGSYGDFAPSPGSLCEIETQLTIADRLGLLSSENASRLSEAAGEIARMLNGLVNALKRSMAA
jgi:four helix bundle protein